MSQDPIVSREMSERLSDLNRAERSRAVALATGKAVAVWVTLFGAYYLAPAAFLVAGEHLMVLVSAPRRCSRSPWSGRYAESAGPGFPPCKRSEHSCCSSLSSWSCSLLLSLDGRHLGPELL